MSDDDLNDIDEQVQILEFAFDGKFDNNRRSNKFVGQVDFSSHEDNVNDIEEKK